jgi:hypothetical protein
VTSRMNAAVNRAKPMACPSSHRSRNAAQPAGTVPGPCTGNRRFTGYTTAKNTMRAVTSRAAAAASGRRVSRSRRDRIASVRLASMASTQITLPMLPNHTYSDSCSRTYSVPG